MGSVALIESLHRVLKERAENPYPETPNPPDVKKRASVALVIRIQPQYDHWPSAEGR